jgi:hypothetical protein
MEGSEVEDLGGQDHLDDGGEVGVGGAEGLGLGPAPVEGSGREALGVRLIGAHRWTVGQDVGLDQVRLLG